MSNSSKIGILILAAGASKRLGQPKQLVAFQDKNLLQHTIDSTGDLDLCTKVLIVGANAKEVLKQVNIHNYHTCLNEEWEEGMGSSLSAGLKESLTLEADLEAIMVLVVDQPFINGELLQSLVESYNSSKCIVASKYGEVTGVPAVFDKKYFGELLNLSGDQGAKRILKKHQVVLETVRFDQGNFDIDTPEDLDQLKHFE